MWAVSERRVATTLTLSPWRRDTFLLGGCADGHSDVRCRQHEKLEEPDSGSDSYDRYTVCEATPESARMNQRKHLGPPGERIVRR